MRPHLEYGAPVWSPYVGKLAELVENVQRRATKTIPGFFDLSYPARLQKLKLPTMAYRRIRGDMIQVYKMLNKGYDSSLPCILPLNSSNQRGHDKKLNVRHAHLHIRKYNFSHRVVRLWNDLPDHVVNAKDILDFEKGMDEHWADQNVVYKDHKAEIILKNLPARYRD